MSKLGLATCLVVFSACSPVLAQGETKPIVRQFHQRVKAGQPTRISTWFLCSKQMAPQVNASVDHGSLQRVETFRRRCGYSNYPVAEYIYTSPPGFAGVATATFYPNYAQAPTIRRLMVTN